VTAPPEATLAWPGPVPTGAIVLDCDGLLVNTQAAWDRAYLEIFEQHGVTLAPGHITALTGLGLEAVGTLLAATLRSEFSGADLAASVLARVNHHLPELLAPMPGACELVQALRGTRRLAVASNAPTSVATGYLAPFFDLGAFDTIIGGDQVAVGKPAPDLYLHACTRLGVRPNDAVALEDSPAGAKAAVEAGLYLIAVPHPGLSFPCHLRVASLRDPQLHLTLVQPPTAGKRLDPARANE